MKKSDHTLNRYIYIIIAEPFGTKYRMKLSIITDQEGNI